MVVVRYCLWRSFGGNFCDSQIGGVGGGNGGGGNGGGVSGGYGGGQDKSHYNQL